MHWYMSTSRFADFKLSSTLEAVTRSDPDPELDEPRDGILTPALLALLTRRGIRLRRRERLPDLEVLDAADAALEHEDAYETDRCIFGLSSLSCNEGDCSDGYRCARAWSDDSPDHRLIVSETKRDRHLNENLQDSIASFAAAQVFSLPPCSPNSRSTARSRSVKDSPG
jgi:hypothetical protein